MSVSFVVDSGTDVDPSLESPHLIRLDSISTDFTPDADSALDLNRKMGAPLRRRIQYAYSRLRSLNSQRAIFLTRHPSRDFLGIAAHLKKALPKLEVVLGADQLDFQDAVDALKGGWIDAIVRTADPVQAALQVHTRGTAQPEIQMLWRDRDRLIRWNRKREEVPAGRKVLLVLMPAWNNDFPPSGLAHIAAALKAAGSPVDVLDLNFEFSRMPENPFKDSSEYGNYLVWTNQKRYQAEVRPSLDGIFKRLEEQLLKGDYAYVGFSLFDTNIPTSRDAFKLVRQTRPDVKIFCGGPSCELDGFFAGRKMLESNQVDALVFGEGEVSAVDLIAAWNQGEDRSVDGACVRGPDGSLRQGGNRPLANINTLPLPDFSGFNVYNYDKWVLPVYFSRGCVARCTFCSETQFWVRFRIQTPERLIQMIKRSVEEFGITEFRFTDSLLNGSHRHLEKFIDQVIEQNLKIRFYGYCRLDNDLNTALLRKMARAGCSELAFGMESASQRVTDLMRKEVDVGNYSRIIKDAFAAGINSCCCVIVGFPGETWLDFFKTVAKIVELGRYIHTLNLSVPTLAQISKSEDDMKLLGIRPEALAADEWQTFDGSNTPKTRMIRFWLLQKAWRLAKRKKLAPSWIYRPA